MQAYYSVATSSLAQSQSFQQRREGDVRAQDGFTQQDSASDKVILRRAGLGMDMRASFSAS